MGSNVGSAQGGKDPDLGPGVDPARHPEGVFIVLEGVEGSGKSTQVDRLRQALVDTGRDVVMTREPGGTELGEELRELVLRRGSPIDPRAETLLFAAARAQLAAHVLRPALQRGAVVLSDRYVHSSLAYQGVGRSLGVDAVRGLSAWATEDLKPHLVVVLDVDPAVGRQRRQRSDHRESDRIEDEDDTFHTRVAEGFRTLAAADAGTVALVSGEGSPDTVAAAVRAVVGQRLRLWS